MAKDLEMGYLLDFYGEVLTQKQREMLRQYYNDDLSLSEIGENFGITRQGARDAIKHGETRLFYCDPRRSDQKGACERNHVELRKLLPKGAGLRFDRLSAADLALAMSHVNSEPRGALGFSTPARAFRAMLGEDAAALLDAYGVEDVALGELDLTPGLIERARAERGDAPLA